LADRPAEKKDRAAAIEKALADVRAEVGSHGGSREAWAKQLAPFRADVAAIKEAKDWVKPGADNFRFMDKGVNLLALDRLEPPAEGKGPVEAIVSINKQLQARDIDLIVVVIPDKEAVYPDKLSKNCPADRAVNVAANQLLDDLLSQDVEVIDLYKTFRDYRTADKDATRLYQLWDTHWHNAASALAAKEIAARLKRYDVVRAALAKENPFTTEPGSRPGKTDLGGPGAKAKAETDKSLWDPFVAIKTRDGKPYADDPSAPILLFSDSFGFISIHLSAHLPAQVANEIHMPIAHLYREGMGPQVPVELGKDMRANPDVRRRVVVWTAVARTFNRTRWATVELPK
jgi:hypothetical protein